MGIQTRLAQLAERAGNAAKLADLCGIKRNTLYGWIKGPTEPRSSDLAVIADATNVDLNWLVTGIGLDPENSGFSDGGQSSNVAKGDLKRIPAYDIEASAGAGRLVLSEDVDYWFSVGRAWIDRIMPAGARAGIIRARGDSMEPTIRDGDLLLLNFDIDRRAIDAGGVFVLTVDGSLLVKRIQVMLDGQILILSDNRRYEPERISREFADEHMTVHAQVVWTGGPVRA